MFWLYMYMFAKKKRLILCVRFQMVCWWYFFSEAGLIRRGLNTARSVTYEIIHFPLVFYQK